MSDVLLTLAHFCDKHGPRTLLVTQVGLPGSQGNELLPAKYPEDTTGCEACSFCYIGDSREDIRSMRTRVGEYSFVSSQYSMVRYTLLTSIVRRAFSEETMTYDNSPMVFYDDVHGLNMMMGFKLYDENARGNERRYCIMLTIDSKNHKSSMELVSANWNLLNDSFMRIITYIRQQHKIETERQTDLKKESDSLTPLVGNYLRANKIKTSRSLVSLTNDDKLFLRIHKWNTFILFALISKMHKPA